MKKKIVIAGATGFIGRWIIKEFEKDFKIIALSRKKILHQQNKNVEWRKLTPLECFKFQGYKDITLPENIF